VFTIVLSLVGPLVIGRTITSFAESYAESVQLLDEALAAREMRKSEAAFEPIKEAGYELELPTRQRASDPASHTVDSFLKSCDGASALFTLDFLISRGAIAKADVEAAAAAWKTACTSPSEELHKELRGEQDLAAVSGSYLRPI
jgi:hypothetical protein